MTVDLLNTRLPIVAAPMAGGPTTVALAQAVASAGGFPFLAGGYKTVDQLAEQIGQLRETADRFGVNLFVPNASTVDLPAFEAYARELEAEAAAYGLELDAVPVSDDDHWAAKLDYLVANPVPVVSFTFGLPEAAAVAALHSAGTRVVATVTSREEAANAKAVGADAVVLQGFGAGGHSAVHEADRDPAEVPLTELVADLVASVGLPVIAAGGVDGPDAVARLLEAGAVAVAVGTLLLRSDEAGTSAGHRQALGDPAFERTVITRAFTGRPARALRNGFIERHGETNLTAYPAVHHLTRALRQAAGKALDLDRLHLWAGTGWRSAREEPAVDVIARLAAAL